MFARGVRNAKQVRQAGLGKEKVQDEAPWNRDPRARPVVCAASCVPDISQPGSDENQANRAAWASHSDWRGSSC
jgi:hypothetical protein